MLDGAPAIAAAADPQPTVAVIAVHGVAYHAPGSSSKAKRAVTAPGGESEVHIYEAYWADLARPKNSLLSFFFALFQLLLHVGSLSRLAIEAGAAENPGWVWRAFRAVQEYAVRILQIPIPLLNLILLIAAFSVLPQQLQQVPR